MRSERVTDQYQTLRSVSDNHLFVVCRDGGFYELPEHVRHRGPWQGQQRGELGNLNTQYLLDIEERGGVRASEVRGGGVQAGGLRFGCQYWQNAVGAIKRASTRAWHT